MAVCFVPCCARQSQVGGMCPGHYKRRWRGDFSDTPIACDPPLPPGLLAAISARLEAVARGRDHERQASRRLMLLIDDLLDRSF